MRRVAILHPDLGIGGAEALIITLALALQSKDYADVTIYTPFYDRNRCLKESYQCKVVVAGAWFPRTIFGRCIALCAYIRMMLCALYVLVMCGRFDLYVVDQVSLPVPLLRLRSRVLFYCHHPDKLLCTNRGNILMKAYRTVLDFFEEVTTALASITLVNSEYTLRVYQESFKLINRFCRQRPQILYPACDFTMFDKVASDTKTVQELIGQISDSDIVVTSLNRYERKKDIPLALKAVAGLSHKVTLVIAGGYDERVIENV
jgi:alpha-1,3/alpha-1,6-mannosyltransferase